MIIIRNRKDDSEKEEGGYHTHPINPEGDGESHNNLPPYIVLGYFIYKARSNQI